MYLNTRSPHFELLFRTVSALMTGLSISLLLFILWAILWQGWGPLSLDFVLSPMRGAGGEGGIWYQILGTVLLLITSATVATPFAVALSLLQTHYFSRSRYRKLVSSILHLLNGTPSILFGILGFVFFVKWLEWEKSWLAGGIILGMMILPTVTLALVQRMETIPKSYIEEAMSMGMTEDQITWAVHVPYGWGGLLTGLVLGLARAAGETAPIMFTAAVFSGAGFPSGIKDSPILALPYHIFNLAQDAYSPNAIETAWATAATLTAVVLTMSLIALPFRARSHEEAKK